MGGRWKLTEAEKQLCVDYSQRCCEGYGSGRKSVARALNGAESNQGLQLHSKMGECACCHALGLDPKTALNWGDVPDGGHDLVFRSWKVDVKAIEPRKSFMLWPASKVDMYDDKDFDLLVLMQGDGDGFDERGWISKRAFFWAKKEAADGDGSGLIPGTWFVHQRILWPFENLFLKRGAA